MEILNQDDIVKNKRKNTQIGISILSNDKSVITADFYIFVGNSKMQNVQNAHTQVTIIFFKCIGIIKIVRFWLSNGQMAQAES